MNGFTGAMFDAVRMLGNNFPAEAKDVVNTINQHSNEKFKSMRLNWGQYSGIRARCVPVKNGFQCSHLLPNFGLLFRLII